MDLYFIFSWYLRYTISISICHDQLAPSCYLTPAVLAISRPHLDDAPMLCILFGLWSSMFIGFITEYFTSKSYGSTLKLVKACNNGPAPNIIQSLALDYI